MALGATCLGAHNDPLSPSLVTLVVDALSRLINRGVDKGLIEGLYVGKEEMVMSHL